MNSQRLHSIARLTFGNRASQIYLALAAAAAVLWLLLGVAEPTDPFAGFWMFVVTLPTSLALAGAGSLFFDAMPSWFLYTSVVASVLIQSLCLGALVSRIRTGQRSPAQPWEK
ncbi:SCO4225 family membrane protein [Streptomyces sp. TRM49041]|uniref:SCO4225 family membrane protein n=1 Tax=Streptomyces sp. TRM49041 TaxID=2603216 RepID=UPI0011EEB44A|nr:hypothetical protein [Streptomyces sp. TRM49041]